MLSSRDRDRRVKLLGARRTSRSELVKACVLLLKPFWVACFLPLTCLRWAFSRIRIKLFGGDSSMYFSPAHAYPTRSPAPCSTRVSTTLRDAMTLNSIAFCAFVSIFMAAVVYNLNLLSSLSPVMDETGKLVNNPQHSKLKEMMTPLENADLFFPQNPSMELAIGNSAKSDIQNGAAIASERKNVVDDASLNAFGQLTDLIIVAGHSVFIGENWADCMDANKWALQKHQRDENHLSAFLAQIRTGMQMAIDSPKSLLVFSGGQTRRLTGPMSEAQSYFKIAEHCPALASEFAQLSDSIPQNDASEKGKEKEKGTDLDLLQKMGKRKSAAANETQDGEYLMSSFLRIGTEEHAMDSLQNVLFSICRFQEITGNYPRKISVISWSFKKDRFEALHRKALRYPIEQFQFVGVDGDVVLTANARKYEAMALELYRDDLYGCGKGPLRNVRVKRNPHRRSLPYPSGCPALAPLFQECTTGEGESFLDKLTKPKYKLPWE